MRRLRHRFVAVLALAVLALGACGPSAGPSPSPSAQLGSVTLVLTAGPVCPVERNPPDPACAPRPVAGATVVLLDGDREVARGVSDAQGRLAFQVPFGRYTVHPISDGPFPVPPPDLAVDVGPQPVELPLDYDTGIR